MESVREALREVKEAERQSSRGSLVNRNRKLVTRSNTVTRSELVKAAKDVKVKRLVSCELLRFLELAFLENIEHCVEFTQVPGALPALITALSGQNAQLQLHAAYALCNLGLANEKISCQIIKAAGPYLNLHMDGMNQYLVEACAWTLGNLATHGQPCVKLLQDQQAIPNLTNLLGNLDSNIRTSTLYALNLIVYHGYNVLKAVEVEEMSLAALNLYPDSAFLLSMLSSHSSCQSVLLSRYVHKTVLKDLSTTTDKATAMYLLRTLANLVCEETGAAAADTLEEHQTLLALIYNLASHNVPHSKKEMLWMLGNLFNHFRSDNERVVLVLGMINDKFPDLFLFN